MAKSKWLKVLLGVLVSAGIFIGVAALAYDSHPLRDRSIQRQQDACFESNRYRPERERTDCIEPFRRRAEGVDRNERLLALGLGAAAVGLFWLVAYLAFIRPRRRRAGA